MTSNGRYIVGGILILVGLSWLTGFGLFRFIIPLLLIWWGWSILSGRQWHGRIGGQTGGITTEDTLNDVLIFSGTQRSVESKDFQGGKIVTVFGSAELDLSRAKTSEKKIELELYSVFGGIHLRVPENWTVESEAVSIIGGVQNRTIAAKEKAVRLHINGAAVFGGIEIVH